MYKHHVQYYETDKMAVTHHSNYIRWMEEARIAFLAEIGWNFISRLWIFIRKIRAKIECAFMTA